MRKEKRSFLNEYDLNISCLLVGLACFVYLEYNSVTLFQSLVVLLMFLFLGWSVAFAKPRVKEDKKK